MAIIKTMPGVRGLETSKLVLTLFGLAILLIPYDAIRYLPSNYRPLILVPLALTVLLCARDFLRVGLGQSVGFLAAFSCYAVVITFVDFHIFGSTGNYLDCLATIFIGLFVFFVGYCCFKIKAQLSEMREYVLWFSNLVSKAYVLPMLVGLLQVACLFGILPHSVAAAIAEVTGAPQVGRIALASSEASWASIQMLFAIPLFYISYRNTKNRLPLIELIVFVIMFVVNVSAQGFATLGLSLILFPLLLSYVRGDVLDFARKSVPMILVAVALVAGLLLFVQVFPVPEYVRDRFAKFVSIDNLIHSDGSSFIRICYPLLSLKMWADSPIFGLGGGSFSGLFPEYIANMFPWAIDGRFKEVTGHFVGAFEPSACNLYTRTLSEFGLIGFLLYISFIAACLKGLKGFKGLPNYELNSIILWACVLIAIPVQFQSYCYVHMLLGLAFIAVAGSCGNKSVHEQKGELGLMAIGDENAAKFLTRRGAE